MGRIPERREPDEDASSPLPDPLAISLAAPQSAGAAKSLHGAPSQSYSVSLSLCLSSFQPR